MGTTRYRWAEAAIYYTGSVVLCLVLLVWILRLDQADLRVPFNDTRDAVLHAMLIKWVIDTGWIGHNPYLGAPFGSQLYDFPFYDMSSIALIKILALFSSNFGLVMNLFYLVTFPLTLVSSLIVFRIFKISYPTAMVVSLLFTFLPYHFERNEGHLCVASYFLLPPMTMLVLWVWTRSARDLPTASSEPIVIPWLKLTIPANYLILAAFCSLVGSMFVYYVFFGCYFLLLAAIASAIRLKSVKHLAPGLGLAAAVFVVFLISTSPTWLYAMRHGKNSEVGTRDPHEAEVFGLKLTQLLLPIRNHRVGFLRDLRRRYDERTVQNEAATANIGLLADMGFGFLLGWLLFSFPRSDDETDLFGALATLSIAAVLLGTVGGLGSIFSFVVHPEIRSYNRISVYIGFFSLFAVALLLDRLHRRIGGTAIGNYCWYVVLALVLVLGVLDQTSPAYVFDYDQLAKRFRADDKFIAEIEFSLEPGSMIFELPNVTFPEAPLGVTGTMEPYDQLRPYLHSRSIEWSAGAMRGRAESRWPEFRRLNIYEVQTEQGPLLRPITPQAVQALALAGFRGIYVDRHGFADLGNEIVSQLDTIVGHLPLESEDKRYAFFDLSSFEDQLRSQYGPEQWEITRRRVLKIPSLPSR